MTNFKGTKGKWKIHKGSHYYSVKYEENERGEINLFMISEDYKGSHSLIEECEANALLISKAPEMLEMLGYLIENDYIANLDNVKKVKQLIKEATEL